MLNAGHPAVSGAAVNGTHGKWWNCAPKMEYSIIHSGCQAFVRSPNGFVLRPAGAFVEYIGTDPPGRSVEDEVLVLGGFARSLPPDTGRIACDVQRPRAECRPTLFSREQVALSKRELAARKRRNVVKVRGAHLLIQACACHTSLPHYPVDKVRFGLHLRSHVERNCSATVTAFQDLFVEAAGFCKAIGKTRLITEQ